MRSLKNTETDKNVLNRELQRMQHIDRLKVMHAENSIYNADVGQFLPSVDNAFASRSLNNVFLTQSHALTPNPALKGFESPSGRIPGSLISTQDIITKQELKGICERHGSQPSERKRIIIARSQEPHAAGFESERPKLGSLDSKALDQMNLTHHFKNDSKMSIQAGALKKVYPTNF